MNIRTWVDNIKCKRNAKAQFMVTLWTRKNEFTAKKLKTCWSHWRIILNLLSSFCCRWLISSLLILPLPVSLIVNMQNLLLTDDSTPFSGVKTVVIQQYFCSVALACKITQITIPIGLFSCSSTHSLYSPRTKNNDEIWWNWMGMGSSIIKCTGRKIV